ncbi:MAG TPA: hypothetical protein VK462_07475 [Nitrososphaeraceae archaeon]|nr:hypothetical protein [Nitrososphaeraceae archaeon]
MNQVFVMSVTQIKIIVYVILYAVGVRNIQMIVNAILRRLTMRAAIKIDGIIVESGLKVEIAVLRKWRMIESKRHIGRT